MIMASDVTRGLQTESIEIETPLTKTQGDRIAGAPPLVVPVLRAGLTMAEGFLDVMPEAVVGHIGVYRDHDTKRPVEYLVKLPEAMGQKVFVVDPMLATGYSAAHAFQCLIKAGFHPDQCAMVALVGAPEGVRVFQENFPDVPVYLAALDEKLNDDAYIVPGLGDAGDRLFGS